MDGDLHQCIKENFKASGGFRERELKVRVMLPQLTRWVAFLTVGNRLFVCRA